LIPASDSPPAFPSAFKSLEIGPRSVLCPRLFFLIIYRDAPSLPDPFSVPIDFCLFEESETFFVSFPHYMLEAPGFLFPLVRAGTRVFSFFWGVHNWPCRMKGGLVSAHRPIFSRSVLPRLLEQSRPLPLSLLLTRVA